MRIPREMLCAALAATLSGCVGAGMLTDGSSISVGTTSVGSLRGAAFLLPEGDGYIIPQRWRRRQRNFGTDEIVQLVVRAARRVRLRHGQAVLGVADLSPRGGGPTLEHRSHRSGRDVDLLYYTADLKGRPLRPTNMIPFDGRGQSLPPPASQPASPQLGSAPPPSNAPSRGLTDRPPAQPADGAPGGPWPSPPSPTLGPNETLDDGSPTSYEPQRIDVAPLWTLIQALVTDPQTSVQWIFIDRGIGELVLAHARGINAPPYIIERAREVMRHAPAHHDHLHVRVFCAPSDRAHGCIDRGPGRWLKKDLKYRNVAPLVAPLVPQEITAIPSGMLAVLRM